MDEAVRKFVVALKKDVTVRMDEEVVGSTDETK